MPRRESLGLLFLSLTTLGRLSNHKKSFFSAEDFVFSALFAFVVAGIGFTTILAVSTVVAEANEFVVLDSFDYFVNVNAHLIFPFSFALQL